MFRQRVVVINADPCSRPQRTVLEVRRINGNSRQLRAKDQRVVADTSPGMNFGVSWTHRSRTVISTRGSDPNKETRQKKRSETINRVPRRNPRPPADGNSHHFAHYAPRVESFRSDSSPAQEQSRTGERLTSGSLRGPSASQLA